MSSGDTKQPATELGVLRVLSPNAGIRVSPLQLGGMSIGQAWTKGMGSMDKEGAFKLLDAFVEAGGNFIDTSNGYQNEESETWIGEWMTERQNRDQLIVATKFTSDYRAHRTGKGTTPNTSGNHKKSLHVSIKDSLRKLQTDYVDILYMHWYDWTTSIKEIMDSMHIFVEQGKVLYLGISDSPAWVASAANTYAISHGKTPFSIYQGRWNIMTRDFERDIIPMARHFGMALAPWDVLGAGRFMPQKVLEERKKQGEPIRTFAKPDSEQTENEKRMGEALAKVAAEHGDDVSHTAVALAYVMAKAANVFPIIGGRKVEHLKDNIRALSLHLTTEQVEYLESVNKFEIGFPGTFVGEDPAVNGSNRKLAESVNIKFPNARGLTSL
jgi:aryl-alcohol dehydrogenase-like predicted oxidoreductase